ncbi:MFS family permease [Clostridium algifaecis]|uniref:MFS family permease n=1 Tax=Clostridium algifaecis TaxID=1472040 RepID=A0ABS4KMT2_9CLOT|nr:MFS transporter [Clostridium algifaecis]MBP2031347.1 MFS family permease [Clostridium algifaecis]
MNTQSNPVIAKSYQNKVLASSILGFAVEMIDIMILSFVLTSIIKDFHISSAYGGLVSSITNLGMLLGGVVFGVLADKKGRVHVFTYTILIFAVATGLIAFSTNIYMLYALRFIAGIGAGGEYAIGMSLVAEAFPKEKHGRMTSYVGIGGQVGSIVAAIAAAIIFPIFGWRVLFLIGIIPVILAFVVRRHLDESPVWLASKNKHKGEENKVSLKELFSTPKTTVTTISLIIMATVQIAGYFGLMNWLPSILQKRLGLSVTGSSLWMISTIVGMSLGMLLFGRIMDKFGAKVSYAIFLACSAASVFLYIYASNSIEMLIGGIIVGFFANGMFSGYGALISNLYPTEIRSTANNTIFNIGRAVGGFSPFAIGFFLDHYSLTIAMLFLSILYVISFITILRLKITKKSEIDSEYKIKEA